MPRPQYNNSECISQMRRMRNLHHSKRKTFTQIARKLNEDMIYSSPTGIKGGWHPTSVKNILSRPTPKPKRKRVNKQGITSRDYLKIYEATDLFTWCLNVLDLRFTTTFNARRKPTFRRQLRAAKITLALMLTGIRRKELCKLRVQGMPIVHHKCEITLVGKGNKLASIRITPWAEAYFNWVCGGRRTGYVFNNEAGKKYNPRSINEILAGVGRKSKIGELRPHMLRHTYASILLWCGCNIGFVRNQLRHSTIASTDIYTHVLWGKLPEDPPSNVALFLQVINPMHPKNIHTL